LKRRVRAALAPYESQPSISTPALLQGGNDRAFQRLLFDLFTIADRLERVRVHVASRVGLSGPQYSLLRAVASLQGKDGVSIGTVAEHLHVTSAFIALQSGVLVQRGLLSKKEDATDRRVSRLSLMATGERLVDKMIEEVRPINDLFFGTLRQDEFEMLAAIVGKLVDSSRSAMVHVSSHEQAALLSCRDNRL
jgi:DNA-binding MarR family transcriptional regulator